MSAKLIIPKLVLAAFLTPQLVDAAPTGAELTRPAVKGKVLAPKPRVEISHDGMSVKSVDSKLGEVLEIIAGKTGAVIIIQGSLDDKVTLEFSSLPFEEGMRRIAPRKDMFFSYRSAGAIDGQPYLLREVRIFDATSNGVVNTLNTRAVSAMAGVASEKKNIGLGVGTAIAALTKRLRDGRDGAARMAAAEQLGKSWDGDAVEPLAQSLIADGDAAVRQAAAEALGNTWSDAAVEPLSQALLQDPSAAVREAAAKALARTWNSAAAESLVSTLLNDTDALVREQAARALAQTGGTEAVGALAYALRNDPRWYVRDAAALSLGSIGGRTAAEALDLALSSDSDSWVRESAASSAADMRR